MFEFFRKKRELQQVRHLYALIVRRARHPDFYKRLRVPDTLDGRFDVLALHVHLYLRALRQHHLGREPFGQGLFDAFFADLDQGLRESGVGDLSVGKKIRRMVEAYYGRAAAYDAAFLDQKSHEAMAEVLRRNIFKDEAQVACQALADYVLKLDQILAQQSRDAVMAGDALKSAIQLGDAA